MGCPCQCCNVLGACCNGASCTQETCTDCEIAGGLWQGSGTQCDGADCPCDPPADHNDCEKCAGGTVESKCPAGETCCGGVCKPGSCCCCDQLTLNDLLYGTSAYSWPTIKPPGKRNPTHGTVGSPPSVSTDHCTGNPNDTQGITDCCNETSPGVFEWTCKGRWTIRPACLRWLCRCVNADGELVCSKTYGGPTANNTDLTTLALNEFGQESAEGCYLYTVEFFGWRRRKPRSGTQPSEWQDRDDLYSIYKTEVTC